jgi:phage terminase large subunit GpA-like protein
MGVHAAIPALAREAAEIIDAPPIRTADEWADARRVLPAGNAEPGAWRSDRVPYTRPICQAFADLASRWVVVVMGSQMAKTETILNIIGHRFDDGPRVPCGPDGKPGARILPRAPGSDAAHRAGHCLEDGAGA